MKRIFIPYLVLALAIALVNLAAAQSKQKAPNFVLKSADGKTYELNKMKGNVVVVNFWATWCPPCRKEIPDFIAIYKKYKDKGVEIIGMSLDDGGWDDILPFLKANTINYPIVLGSQKLASEFGDVRFIPTTFFVDKNGYIVDRHVGAMSRSQLESKIKSLL